MREKDGELTFYLSGPMSGHKDDNFPAFEAAARKLRAAGYKILSPHEMGSSGSYSELLARDVKCIIDADGIFLMEGWMHSRGSRLEAFTASTYGKLVYLLDIAGNPVLASKTKLQKLLWS